jgi:hypothetical protein
MKKEAQDFNQSLDFSHSQDRQAGLGQETFVEELIDTFRQVNRGRIVQLPRWVQ